VDTMIDLSPAVLVPQHTQPIEGKEKILDTLTAYRDAIQFVHDQTVRYMNKGMSGREIAETVKLPAHLATHPYLIEYYGTVEWSVRAVYHGYMGWFSGRPGDLHPLPRREEAEKWVELGGGEGGILTTAELAVQQGEFQWGLQLTDCLADCGKDSDRSKELRGICLRELASKEVSAPGMNWYLTEDMVQQGLEIKPKWNVTASHIQNSDIRGLFRILTVMLDSEATLDITCTALFKFFDTSESVTIIIRRGVCLLPTTTPDTSDIEVETTTQVWKDVVAKKRTALAASLTGDIKVIPGIRSLSTFFGYFDTEQT